MTDRSLQTAIAAMTLAMVGIVAGAWTLQVLAHYNSSSSINQTQIYQPKGTTR